MSAEPLEIHLEEQDLDRGLREDVRVGLAATPKWLPPKWFYDARGSELFEEITRLPEYYPTRAERAVLAAHADEIAALTGAKTLIELGSGSSEKTRLLLDAFTRHGDLGSFVPLDVSVSALRGSTEQIAAAYPGLRVRGIVGDFTRHLDRLPTGGRRLVLFLGGTIGNLLPVERAEFLTSMRAALEAGDWLLVGTDLVKDPAVLVPAYDDAAGVTAEFNRNVLRVINRELGADFDPAAFRHVAVWDPEHEWIEMRLRAERPVRVRVLDLDVRFAAGEDLRTEISAKFRPDGIARELAAAGFVRQAFWTDPDGLFGVSLARAD
ncbi:L-histidine N(alpha)-methyltransferase [Micromonospora terminaliae]|uniref:Histidine N-alpha-methyltransferase n=1 Tax=Micromonospora terminaliae TaxID=1914461 RepID=A0AAJ2ZCA3_9ACTN|nr:L-histidine N(alpha)-methyltransferase [Micromonospora terminaliae]NES27397.1 L-histidine N(alpha)-methyltransferase [Micromonospora terminaliae]QGL47860.1 L-histidine N(alpha)-methyltransferase [Micromonospora terminaliae]